MQPSFSFQGRDRWWQNTQELIFCVVLCICTDLTIYTTTTYVPRRRGGGYPLAIKAQYTYERIYSQDEYCMCEYVCVFPIFDEYRNNRLLGKNGPRGSLYVNINDQKCIFDIHEYYQLSTRCNSEIGFPRMLHTIEFAPSIMAAMMSQPSVNEEEQGRTVRSSIWHLTKRD